jgi:predicted phage-related endonuclease
MIDLEAKHTFVDTSHNLGKLDLSQLDLVIDVEDIDKYPNEQYAILRKHGLGTSDSSVICGVNPYTNLEELIQEKSRDYLTNEEKEVGNKVPVRKGRDLEPFIIARYAQILNKHVIKPSDMYRHKDLPWLKFNYDGVVDKQILPDGRYQYIPAEIKVVTQYGIKHYDANKAWYRDSIGFMPLPEDHSKEHNSIVTKAAAYGIPPYYYTQLQQQIFGLNAPFGYLTVLFDSLWEVVSFFVYRDDACINTILANGFKAWQRIIDITRDPNRDDVTELLRKYNTNKEPQEDNKLKTNIQVIEEA